MEYLSNYVRTIIAVSFFYAIISMVLPFGEMKKYSRFAVGIVITLCLIEPLAELKNIKLEDIGYTEISYNEADINTQVVKVFKRRLEEKVKAEFGVDVKIEIDDNFNIISVYTDSEKSKDIEKYLGLT